MEKQLQDEARDVAAPPKTTKRRTLPVRGSPASDVIVVSQESAVVAAMAWKERYEQVLAANQRLKAHLDTIEKAHRKYVVLCLLHRVERMLLCVCVRFTMWLLPVLLGWLEP